jgi:probable rRNA maturation factor
MSARPSLQPSLQLSLQLADARHRALLPRHRVARWIRAALATPAQITVRIVDAEEGRRLNRDYRQQDHATNVITFDYERVPFVSADLVLCAPVIEAEAQELGIEVQAHYTHLLVHGTLHAQGFDHIKAKDAKVMEARETALLATLGIADPYSNTRR